MLDRRQFLFSALACRTLAAQTTDALIDKGYGRVTRFADGVYVTISGNKGLQCISNGGVLAGRDAVLAIEGHFQPAGAALEVEAARLVSKAPILAAVNTHYHFDHTFGNQGYADLKIPIMAHETAPALMKERYAALQGVDKAPLLAGLQQKIAEASTERDKKHFQSDLGMTKWMYGAIDHTTLAYPNQLLGEKDLPKSIDLGGLKVRIEHYRGHTPTDLILRVPEHDVVFTGDLLFYKSYPVAFDADMIAWRKVLQQFAGYAPSTRFVVGHGPICGLEVVRDQIDLFDDLRAHAEKLFREGASVDEAERRFIVPKRFEDHEISSWHWCIGGALSSYYAGLKKA